MVGLTVRNPCAELQVVTALAPPIGQRREPFVQVESHSHGARRRSGTGTGSLKQTIIPSPANRSTCLRAPESLGPFPRGIRAARSSLFGLRRFRERREPVQVDKHYGHLTTTSLQRIFGSALDDHLCDLRREEALQAAEPLEHRDLIRHAFL